MLIDVSTDCKAIHLACRALVCAWTAQNQDFTTNAAVYRTPIVVLLLMRSWQQRRPAASPGRALASMPARRAASIDKANVDHCIAKLRIGAHS